LRDEATRSAGPADLPRREAGGRIDFRQVVFTALPEPAGGHTSEEKITAASARGGSLADGRDEEGGMSKLSRAVAFGSVLLLAAALVVGDARAADEDTKKAQADILDLAKKLADGKDVEKETPAIRKKYEDLNTLMHAYKPSEKGGIGTGLGPKKGDGIELKIIALGKRPLPAATLKKEADALVKLGYINAALADITTHYAPAKPKAGKGAKEWKQYTKDMKEASLELVKAAQASDVKKVQTAANNLNNSCNNCHSDFRD
jgi:cytochrome c556